MRRRSTHFPPVGCPRILVGNRGHASGEWGGGADAHGGLGGAQALNGRFDLFETFRWLLAIVCSIYAAVCIWRSLIGWLTYFASSRQTAILGRYTLVLLLRVRARRFAAEVLQIVVLTVILLLLLSLHRH